MCFFIGRSKGHAFGSKWPLVAVKSLKNSVITVTVNQPSVQEMSWESPSWERKRSLPGHEEIQGWLEHLQATKEVIAS